MASMNELRKPAGQKGGKPDARWSDRWTVLQASRPESQQAGEVARSRKPVIRHHWELEVHRLAVEVAMQIFELSKKWPAEEKFSLTDQARRASRSVATQIAEAWRKRKYEAAFVSKLNDAEGEAAETQDWVMFAVKCGYVDRETGIELHQKCDRILGKLTKMGNNPGPWLLNRTSPKPPD